MNFIWPTYFLYSPTNSKILCILDEWNIYIWSWDSDLHLTFTFLTWPCRPDLLTLIILDTHSSSGQQHPVTSVRLTPASPRLHSAVTQLSSLASVAALHTFRPLSMFSEPQQSRISEYLGSSSDPDLEWLVFRKNINFAAFTLAWMSAWHRIQFPRSRWWWSWYSLHRIGPRQRCHCTGNTSWRPLILNR